MNSYLGFPLLYFDNLRETDRAIGDTVNKRILRFLLWVLL